MEAYLDGDVEINNNVTTPEEDAAHEVEAADQTADIATDAGEVATDVKNDDVATQMLLRTGRLYYHVKKYGVDRTFLRLYNQHGEMDRMCGIQFPSCEAMNATGNPYSHYSAAFIAAMEDEKTGFWTTIWQKIQDAWKWIKDHIAALWNKILQFFGVRARDLQKLISEIEKKYDTNAEVTLAKGSKLSLVVDPAKNPVNKLLMKDYESNKSLDKTIFTILSGIKTELKVEDFKEDEVDESLKAIDEYTKEFTEDKEESEGVEVKKKLSEVLKSLNDYVTPANTFLRRQDALKKMSEQALKKVADVVNKAKENADDEKKKKLGEMALKMTNFVKKVNGLTVVAGKFIIKTTNAYCKELSKVVKQLKPKDQPKEKPADNAGGDASDKSGGDKNATAMFAFL
jgi:hypothetical protein